ncbi:enamine deaminase RidA (YjgF/YER057c/UK114 family) [Pontibacter aydingkolensis]|uniref:RidA family protein n=1 Tax=Pontibacter aydingkolensis TaxID=1911536 RepID=A0ABS7CVA0_9BACT|nr:RidA family protein [Pontibacter aydingkolensis]MBW7467793.1 RidA family protein [Pontibacter aydingkolensis]
MISPEERLQQLGILLPEPVKPVANYVTYIQTGNLLFLSGHGYCGAPTAVDIGKLGRDLTVEQGYLAARNSGICILATIKHALGDLGSVKRIVRVLGMVNATDDFADHPKVINGFSDLMVDVFGEKGRHVRSAVGMGSLPGGIAVEIEVTLEVATE